MESSFMKWAKVAAVALLCIFYASFIVYKIPLPAAEDLPRQMQNGEEILAGNFHSLSENVYSYTAPDHYFANHHWLYGVFAYILYVLVGWKGMVIFKVLFLFLTFAFLFAAALKKADFWLVVLVSVPTIIMLMGRSSLRPEMFGYFFIALYVYVLLWSEERPSSWWLFLLLPVQILWANLHITFPIGVMIVGGFWLEKVIFFDGLQFRERFTLEGIKKVFQNAFIQKLILLIFLLTAVSFINPHGISGVIYSLGINTKEGAVVSAEVQPLFSHNDDIPENSYPSVDMLPELFILALVSFIVGYRKKSLFYFLGTLASILLTIKVIRSFPFFAMFFLLAVTANFNDPFLKLKSFLERYWPAKKVSLQSVLASMIVLFLIFYTIYTFPRPLGGNERGIGLTTGAEDAINFYKSNQLSGPLFNDTDIGSYLIWYLYPEEKVFADNRFGDAYPPEILETDYADAIKSEERWKEVSEKYRFNTIFIYQYDGMSAMRDFLFNRINDPEWAFVYADRYSVILVRNIPENQAVIDQYHITSDNAPIRFSELITSKNGADLVTAGDIFGLMGQIAWARGAYAQAVAMHPDWAKIWWVMGRMELARGDRENSDPNLALVFLTQAINGGWKTVNTYSYLALAYYRLGLYDQAEAAVRKEMKLNPLSEDAKIWLGKIAEARAGESPK
jgi:tetratricopeptide (TPR) repeat protein